MIVIAGLAGVPRLLLPRRFAELQQAKLKQPKAVSRTRLLSLLGIAGALVFSLLFFTHWRHETWLPVAIVFSVLSSAEFFFQATFNSLEALVFQNRLLGILYIGLCVASYLMLSRV